MLENQEIKMTIEESERSRNLSGIIEKVEEAIRDENSQLAYERSLQATQAAPTNVQAWLLRASLAPSLEERILCVNRLNQLEPDHQDSHNIAFFTLKELLEHDPYLGYLEESDKLYHVLRPDHRVLSIPKKRSTDATPYYKRKDELKTAHRWLALASFGLMFAGLLTLVFAPLAAWSAINSGRSSGTHAVQVRSAIVVLSSTLLFVVGLFFGFLLLLHVMG